MNTSHLIKCGYDMFRNQIVNITLKQSNLWKTGFIILNNNIHFYRLNPLIETKLEIIKINNSFLLMANSGIIYENSKPFLYDTELIVEKNKSINNCFDYEFIKISEIKELNNFRCLN